MEDNPGTQEAARDGDVRRHFGVKVDMDSLEEVGMPKEEAEGKRHKEGERVDDGGDVLAQVAIEVGNHKDLDNI